MFVAKMEALDKTTLYEQLCLHFAAKRFYSLTAQFHLQSSDQLSLYQSKLFIVLLSLLLLFPSKI